MTELKLRVRSLNDFFEGVRKSAVMIDRGDFTPQAASVSFTSMEQLFGVLTPNRWTLLARLRAVGPTSIRTLAKELSRDYRGVHADVTALLDVGLVERDDAMRISVPWSKITAEMSLEKAA